MIRFLKVSTLIGAGFVVGIYGMRRAFKDGALSVSESGDVRINTPAGEYAKESVKRITNFGKDEEG